MSIADDFAPWQQRIYVQASAALDSGRLGHGLLICGPARLGKRALAERLAKRMLCTDRDMNAAAGAGLGCGHCRSCQLFAAGTHPDFAVVTLEMNKEGTKLRTEIVIEQIRNLSERMALTTQYGGAQIVILDPADAINHAACNALLKTLEEPHPGRYLWLISANPGRLPATIRSRCQRLEFRLPPALEALAWLQGRGHAAAAASEALDAARGHPGLADRWLREGGLDLASRGRRRSRRIDSRHPQPAGNRAALGRRGRSGCPPAPCCRPGGRRSGAPERRRRAPAA